MKTPALDRSGSISTSRAPIGPGMHVPAVGLVGVDAYAAAAQLGDRHVDVRHRRQGGAGVPQVEALVEARTGEQERRDELAGRRRVDLECAAGDVTGSVDRERQGAAAVVVDLDAEIAECRDRRAHRAYAGVLVTVERHRCRAEGRERRDEAHDGAGEAAVDVGWARSDPTPTA